MRGSRHGIRDVDDRVEQHDEERAEQRHPDQRRQIQAADRLARVQPDSVQVVHRFGEDRAAADHLPEVEPEQRDNRNHRVAKHVADADLTLGEPLGPSGADVVLVHRVEHVGAQHSAVEPDEEHSQREPRQDQVVCPTHRILRQWHVAARREQLDLEGEEVQQNRRQPEDRHRDPGQRKDCQRAVGELACLHRTHVAEEHRRTTSISPPLRCTSENVAGTPSQICSTTLRSCRVGHQLAGEDLLHHRQVLHGQGLVEAPVLF